jgi:N-acetylmuramic acid 6-phosphate etherase
VKDAADGSVPVTERVNLRTQGLDRHTTFDLVALLAREQRAAFEAVQGQSELLAQAVDEIAARLRRGGRLHYVGAGSSGRLGVLDASEMPPTFGTPPSLVCAHIAGGAAALTTAIEGAEDDFEAGAGELRGHVLRGDAVVGLSASGAAPYVLGALETSRAAGAWTLGIAGVAGSPLLMHADLGIVLETGPEPLTGSTRLLAGTAQKIALNTISTATMVRLGKVYGNLMVDMVATNAKLRKRALRLVMQLVPADAAAAEALLRDGGGAVKTAVVMGRCGVGADEAVERLKAAGGSLAAAVGPDEGISSADYTL